MDENQEVVLTARRTESMDAPAIQKLMTSATYDIFGRVDIINVMYVKWYFVVLSWQCRIHVVLFKCETSFEIGEI